jgi:hypothetical protein
MLDIGQQVKITANSLNITGKIAKIDKDEFWRIWYEVTFDESQTQDGLHGTTVTQTCGEFQECDLSPILG